MREVIYAAVSFLTCEIALAECQWASCAMMDRVRNNSDIIT